LTHVDRWTHEESRTPICFGWIPESFDILKQRLDADSDTTREEARERERGDHVHRVAIGRERLLEEHITDKAAREGGTSGATLVR
jgi:hypothetical protein